MIRAQGCFHVLSIPVARQVDFWRFWVDSRIFFRFEPSSGSATSPEQRGFPFRLDESTGRGDLTLNLHVHPMTACRSNSTRVAATQQETGGEGRQRVESLRVVAKALVSACFGSQTPQDQQVGRAQQWPRRCAFP